MIALDHPAVRLPHTLSCPLPSSLLSPSSFIAESDRLSLATAMAEVEQDRSKLCGVIVNR